MVRLVHMYVVRPRVRVRTMVENVYVPVLVFQVVFEIVHVCTMVWSYRRGTEGTMVPWYVDVDVLWYTCYDVINS
jgi:hypothetical protein